MEEKECKRRGCVSNNLKRRNTFSQKLANPGRANPDERETAENLRGEDDRAGGGVRGQESEKRLQVIRHYCQHRGNSSVGANGSLTDISLSPLPISPLIRCANTKAGVRIRMYKHANSCTPTHFLKRVKKSPAASIDYLPAAASLHRSRMQRRQGKSVRRAPSLCLER